MTVCFTTGLHTWEGTRGPIGASGGVVVVWFQKTVNDQHSSQLHVFLHCRANVQRGALVLEHPTGASQAAITAQLVNVTVYVAIG